MIIPLIIALILGVPQVLFLLLVGRNYRHAVSKLRQYQKEIPPFSVALIVPCRGLDTQFRENITSLYQQKYENYRLVFVVSDTEDEAYPVLCEIRDRHASGSSVQSVEILCAGQAEGCGQKIHNLLCGVRHVAHDVGALAFADADVQMGPYWLINMILPLKADKHGASSGYRWFVPQQNNSASIALSNINARVTQFLGNTRFNHTWGGSMAIRTELFYEVQLDKIWERTISDDYSLSLTVKAARKKVAYVPLCLNPSIERMDWRSLLKFLQRQFIITRVCAPGTWWFALWASAYSCLGLWIPLVMACLPGLDHSTRLWCAGIAATFAISQCGRAILRQMTALALLAPYRQQLRAAVWADILLFPLMGFVLLAAVLSSAWTRVITWRGIRYRLISLTETIRLDDPPQP